MGEQRDFLWKGSAMARIYDDITQLIGNTPLVRIRKLFSSQATVLAKLESRNPMASVGVYW